MASYIVRRLLLMIPTLIGMTALVFFVVAMSPGGIGESLISQESGMRPAEREARRRYYNERYGLDKPAYVQYGRWLNKVSPIGFRTWKAEDDEVKQAAAKEKPLHDAKRPELVAKGLTTKQIEKELSKIDIKPNAGDAIFSKPAIKMPDLGESVARGRRVDGLIMEALPITLLLNVISIPITYSIAIVTGIYAARHRGKVFDVASGTTFLAMWSFPQILAGVLAIGFLASDQYLKIFPAGGLNEVVTDSMPFLPGYNAAGAWQSGWLLDRIWHLILPVIVLSYGNFAFLSKLARGAVLENIRADYVRTARAKGLGERNVLFRHVLGNSLIPLITMGAHLLPALIAGSVIVETIFSLPGMGKLTIDAINSRDRELFLSTTMVAGLLGLLGYLLADIMYAVADPRVSYE